VREEREIAGEKSVGEDTIAREKRKLSWSRPKNK
jgi:hypothetical protein